MAEAGTKGGLKRYYDVNGWLFIAPALGLISLFLVYPIIRSLYLSFFTGKGMMMKFWGCRQCRPPLQRSRLHQGADQYDDLLLVVQVPIMITLALLLAAALNNPDMKFRGFLRTAIFLPCVSSLVAYSVLFKSLFAYDGIVNDTLMWIGLASHPVPWFTDTFWARVLIVIAITWRWTGYNMIFYLALQNIDKSIYEAARIDGVPAWGRFLYITVPMLKPVILFTTIISTIGTIQLFDEVYNLLSEAKGAAPCGFDADAVALHLPPDLPLHAELRLCGDDFLRHRGDGGAGRPSSSSMPRGTGHEPAT